MIVNIIDCDVETLRIGDRVEIVWEHVSDDMAVPRFRPIGAASTVSRANRSDDLEAIDTLLASYCLRMDRRDAGGGPSCSRPTASSSPSAAASTVTSGLRGCRESPLGVHLGGRTGDRRSPATTRPRSRRSCSCTPDGPPPAHRLLRRRAGRTDAGWRFRSAGARSRPPTVRPPSLERVEAVRAG